ncbi:MAG: hypothetical protein ACP5LG_06230, partial [Conexivisphaera sp.]
MVESDLRLLTQAEGDRGAGSAGFPVGIALPGSAPQMIDGDGAGAGDDGLLVAQYQTADRGLVLGFIAGLQVLCQQELIGGQYGGPQAGGDGAVGLQVRFAEGLDDLLAELGCFAGGIGYVHEDEELSFDGAFGDGNLPRRHP